MSRESAPVLERINEVEKEQTRAEDVKHLASSSRIEGVPITDEDARTITESITTPDNGDQEEVRPNFGEVA